MNPRNPLRRGLLALALGMTIASAAFAADQTTIRVRTTGGQVERVTVDDIAEFKVGEGRALTTEAGNYALLRREPEKYVLEVAGERFELADFASMDADHAPHFAAHHGKDGKHVVIHRDVDETRIEGEAGKRRIVRIVGAGGKDALAMHDGELPLELDALALDGDGPRVAVIRRVTKESTTQQ